MVDRQLARYSTCRLEYNIIYLALPRSIIFIQLPLLFSLHSLLCQFKLLFTNIHTRASNEVFSIKISKWIFEQTQYKFNFCFEFDRIKQFLHSTHRFQHWGKSQTSNVVSSLSLGMMKLTTTLLLNIHRHNTHFLWNTSKKEDRRRKGLEATPYQKYFYLSSKLICACLLFWLLSW